MNKNNLNIIIEIKEQIILMINIYNQLDKYLINTK